MISRERVDFASLLSKLPTAIEPESSLWIVSLQLDQPSRSALARIRQATTHPRPEFRRRIFLEDENRENSAISYGELVLPVASDALEFLANPDKALVLAVMGDVDPGAVVRDALAAAGSHRFDMPLISAIATDKGVAAVGQLYEEDPSIFALQLVTRREIAERLTDLALQLGAEKVAAADLPEALRV